MWYGRLSLVIWVGLLVGTSALASTALIVKKVGKVKILRSVDSKNANPDIDKKVMVEGKIYFDLKAQVGMELEYGDQVQTSANGRVRLVYNNGDQFSVGTSTSFQVAKKGEGLSLSILFGKIRALVSPKGERANLEVRTSTMVMGVRGTDFHILSNGLSGSSELTVLGGAVEAAHRSDPSVKTIVKTGQSLKFKQLAMNSKPQIDLRKVSAKDLLYIQGSSIFPPSKTIMALTGSKKDTKVVEAEREAVRIFLEEHRETHPNFYKANIKKANDLDLDQIQRVYMEYLLRHLD